MKTEAKHTPTPWTGSKYKGDFSVTDPWKIDQISGPGQIGLVGSEEDAAFILRAVNSQDDLVRHSQYLLEAVRVWFKAVGAKEPVFPSSINAAYVGLESAIAKAGLV